MTSLAERVAAVPRPRPRSSTITAYAVVIGIGVLGVWSLVALDYNLQNWDRTVANLQRFISSATPLVWPGFTSEKLADGTVEITFEGWGEVGVFVSHVFITLAITIAATALAALLSIPVAYGAARNTSPHPTVMAFCRGIGVVARAIPDVALISFLAYLWFGAGTLVAIIAVALHSVGMISKMMADAIEQTDAGPRTAITSVGATKAQQFWTGIVPQALPAWIAVALHRADINLRASVILGVVGVVGLGYDLWQALHTAAGMRRSIPLVIVIVALCILFEIISSSLRARLLGVRPTGKGIGDTVVRNVAKASDRVAAALVRSDAATERNARIEAALHRPWTRERRQTSFWIWLAAAIVVGSFVFAAMDDRSEWAKIFVWRWDLVHNPDLNISVWPPNFGSRDWGDVLGAVLVTIQVAFAATLLSAIVSAVVGPLSARNVAPNGFVRNFFRVFALILRAIPDLVIAIIFIIATGLGPQAGTLALAFGGIGLLAKLIGDSMEEVPNGPEKAIQTVGGTRPQVFFSSTVALSVPALVSHLLYMLEQNIRSATLLGIVGGGGIGFLLINQIDARHFDQVMAFLLVIIALVVVVEGVSILLRHALR
ncbi:PhnE/PtxC family ABC transporter permease [Protaetiibacter larvae]|uniref:ABC transporter permease subunit n=1 Tax=Protaetiibacter larvae TaxID=2592654 RepID=A0A5C1Y602_9MICO|nr:ABC transporter permease subunit [Protaetiibacter larvae]QEO09140.1 ABC transporter permease subunit [Protaetiibacter larvae]